MDYIGNPIDVVLFDRYFRVLRGAMLKDTTLLAFTQTDQRWRATYQDDTTSITFEGRVACARTVIRTKGRTS